ncbi:hypothetical protein PYCCODRAFT_1436823 [Trametes coccinea BRFM310]|uniref:Uncharacterized protein n=1 Tax=Trametes coccinea (strain BRFM310) TaxID=1353009 RepID=A0A1Y2ILG6_TRAC3|nr:hypothetical protein PYCCODRAFT_1436823 [Trametes coccinea BRFM310]
MSSRIACYLRSVVSRPALRASPSRLYTTSASRTASISLSRRICLHPRSVPTKRLYSSSTASSERPEAGVAAQSFADPDRPDLFYHLFPAPTSISSSASVFALSFLSEPPPSVLSAAVIGWLPASGEGGDAGLNDFVENERFRAVLHEAIQSALRDGVDEVQKNGAIQTREGWMHIHDNRNVPALGRIGDPDDIIASVRVENGEILPETYQPMPSYRVCTGDGVLQLTEGLAQRLVEVLQARVREERQRG